MAGVRAGRRWRQQRARVRWSAALGEAICARVAAGELLYVVCREAGMPTPQCVGTWAREKPAFGAALAEARRLSGRGNGRGGGGVWSYCPEVADEIFERMCEGESLTAIGRDPAMPCLSTLFYWRRHIREFEEMVGRARRIQAERFCDIGLELAMEATPQTAYLTEVRLKQLRWMAGVMAPRAYRIKAVEPEAGAAPPALVAMRRFEIEPDPQTGELKMVKYCPNPLTGRIEREDEEGWAPPAGVVVIPA
jgi:hypothetical protein